MACCLQVLCGLGADFWDSPWHQLPRAAAVCCVLNNAAALLHKLPDQLLLEEALCCCLLVPAADPGCIYCYATLCERCGKSCLHAFSLLPCNSLASSIMLHVCLPLQCVPYSRSAGTTLRWLHPQHRSCRQHWMQATAALSEPS